MASKYDDTKNPFYTPDDDDFGAPRRPVGAPPSKTSGYGRGSDSFGGVFDDEFGKPRSQQQNLQMMKENSMNRQLDSTKRALASIYDSEKVGSATAEELVGQGEQLDNVERKVADINADMRVTQRHIDSIKSVWGSMKNWWSGKKEPEKPSRSHHLQPESEPSQLRQTLDHQRESEPHPSLRLKSGDPSGFYDGEETGWGSSDPKPSSGPTQKQAFSPRAGYEMQLEEDIDLMSSGMSRLKGLAQGLGSEIERQNEQLDRINYQVEKADITLRNQNTQMRTILKK